CRLDWPMKDAALARRKAWRGRAQTAPSMRSASASEEKWWIMGQQRGVYAPSPTSSDALPKESCDSRQAITHVNATERPSRVETSLGGSPAVRTRQLPAINLVMTAIACCGCSSMIQWPESVMTAPWTSLATNSSSDFIDAPNEWSPPIARTGMR